MVTDTHILKKLRVVPNAKDAFSDKSREVNLTFGPVSEFQVKVIVRPRFKQDRLHKFIHRKQYRANYFRQSRS